MSCFLAHDTIVCLMPFTTELTSELPLGGFAVAFLCTRHGGCFSDTFSLQTFLINFLMRTLCPGGNSNGNSGTPSGPIHEG